MNRRAAIALVTAAALALAVALAFTGGAARPRRADAADPLAAAPLRPPPTPPAARDLCIAGPGAAASAIDAPDPPTRARRAFAAERLAERLSTAPAFPQRMGLAVSAAPAPTCVPTP